MANIRPVRGTHDLYGETVRRHRHVIETGRRTAELYGYEEIQTLVISTARLNPLLDLHLLPINPVVSREPKKSNLGDGFALRCFQRLS